MTVRRCGITFILGFTGTIIITTACPVSARRRRRVVIPRTITGTSRRVFTGRAFLTTVVRSAAVTAGFGNYVTIRIGFARCAYPARIGYRATISTRDRRDIAIGIFRTFNTFSAVVVK